MTMKTRLPPKSLIVWLPALPFVLTVIIRLLCLRAFIDSPYFLPLGGDRGLYQNMAIAVASGKEIDQVFTFMPLYAYLLGFFYRITGSMNLAAVAIFQALLDGFTSIMVFGIAKRRYGVAAGLIAGLAFAMLGPAAAYSLVTMPVTLTLFWIVLVVTLADRWSMLWTIKRSLAMGLALGIGGQILGSFWLMLIPFGVWVACSKPKKNLLQRIIRGAILVLAGAVCVLPSLSHNIITGNQWVPITAHAGLNFFLGNNPGSKGYATAIPGLSFSAEEMTVDSRALASKLAGRSLNIAESNRFWRQQAYKFWQNNPKQAMVLLLKKTHRLLSLREFDDTGLCRLLPETVPILRLTVLQFGIIWILACLGYGLRQLRFSCAAPAIILGCQALAILVTFVTTRYRLPITMLLLPYAVGTLTSFPRAIENFRLPMLRKLTIGIAGIAIAFSPHALPDTTLTDSVNRSSYWLQYGDCKKALEFAQRAIAYSPTSEQARFTLGNAYMANHYYLFALDAFRQVLEKRPDRTDALFNAAIALEKLGKHGEARSFYERVVKLNPLHAKAWFALAVLYREGNETARSQDALNHAEEIVGASNTNIIEFSTERNQ